MISFIANTHIVIILNFSHSLLSTGFLTRATRLQLVVQ